MGEETEINRDVEVVDSLGLRHSMVLFWMLSWKRDQYELMIDANKYRMIGCDEDDTTPLLRYLTHCANSPVTLYTSGIPEGVIKRVYDKRSAEMSPDISFYSKEEYPHRDFALTCGIRASFCFPLRDFRFTDPYGVMEIVSTRNQDVETLVTFCISFEDGRYLCDTFRENINHLQKYANPVLGLLLDEVCQRFQLPLTQYWACDDDSYRLLNQFSDSAFENLTPWCQFKYACLSKSFQCLLGDSGRSPGAFFCNNISALSITTYPLAHYAQNCGSIACFTIYLLILVEEVDEREYVLEFFLPSKEMDNDYPQNLLNSIWTTIRESLSNIKLAAREREKLRPVLSVKVVNSSTQTESESFEVGHPQTSHPHCKGSEFTRTLKLFDKGPDQSSNLNSYEEAAVRGTSIRILNEASQSRRSGKNFKTKGKTVVVERDEPVEGSIIETPYAICDIDIQNAMTGASQPFRFQTKKTLCQQEETMFIENEGDTSQQLPRISPPLFDNGTEQDEQVMKIQKCAKNNYSYEEISTAAASKRTPECLKQIISWDELEELPINCDEPQSLTSQLRSEVIFGDEGYTVPSDKGDNLVEVSPDEDVEYTVTTASKRLKKSKIPCTEENIRKHFGRSLNDAAESFGYSVSTFKRRCRNVGITWWQSGKSQMTDCKSGATKFSLDASSLPNRHVVSHSNKDCNMMTVKVTYDAGTIRFELPSSSGLEELENSVIKRLQWDRKSFSIKYQDDEDDWIDISCDEDVWECMKVSRSFKKSTIKMKLGPPINSYPG